MTLTTGRLPATQLSPVRLVLAATLASAAILAIIVFALNDIGDRNDFYYELWPPYQSLYGGHLGTFVQTVPFYFGAALWRAPFALLALACGAGWKVTYYLSAVPCLAILPIFGAYFAAQTVEARDQRRRVLVGFCLLGVLDPIVWYTGLLGHPEEIAGIALVFAAVICAAQGRLVWAVGLVLFGITNKPGLAEGLVVVAALLPPRWAKPALIAGFSVVCAYALYNLTPLSSLVPIHELTNGSLSNGPVVPDDFVWWLGSHSWITTHEHVLFVPCITAVAALWWLRRGRDLPRDRTLIREGLWLLVLVLLARTAFDPWDVTYYNLPFVVACFCLEAGERVPRLTIAATVGVLVLVPTNRILPIGDAAQAALYAVVVVPVLIALWQRAFRGPGYRIPWRRSSATRLFASRSSSWEMPASIHQPSRISQRIEPSET